MKKLIISTLILILITSLTTLARTQYDPTGNITKDDSLRGHKKAYQERVHQRMQQKAQQQIAPAAKINYEEKTENSNKEVTEVKKQEEKPLFESNYIQNKK